MAAPQWDVRVFCRFLARRLPPGGDLALLEARIIAELERVAADGVGEDELAKARNLRLAAFWRGLQTINGKASALGNFEVFTGEPAKHAANELGANAFAVGNTIVLPDTGVRESM